MCMNIGDMMVAGEKLTYSKKRPSQCHDNFHSRTVQLDIIRIFYLPTDARENCFKTNIKIYFKTTPTCFGLIAIIRERIIRAC